MNARALTVAAALGTSLVGGGWVLGRGLNVRETDFSNARLFDTVFVFNRLVPMRSSGRK